MEISTIAIIAVVSFLVISITCTAIRHFRAKKSETPELPRYDEIAIPADAIKEFEPIKTHIIELRKAERIRDAIHRAILKNLQDNGYVLRCKDPWRQYGSDELELPDLLELQNIISLKPVIEVIEDQYKRFEEATDKADKEQEFTGHLILKVMSKLNMDLEMQKQISKKFGNKKLISSELYELLVSPEAKKIVERCISEVINGSDND